MFCNWIALVTLCITPPFTTSFTHNSHFVTLRKPVALNNMSSATENDQASICKLLAIYEQSLNTSDADLAASCYTSDGVFMPTTLPTATGTQALKDSYQAIFGNIQLNVKFSIDELVVTSDSLFAYALTQSKGHVTIKATGDKPEEANREIFIFAKDADNEEWKIARYMFNKSS